MNKGNLIWAILIVGLLAGFFLGKWRGKSEARDIYIDNPEMIKEIAELSVLEVDGVTKLTESNTAIQKSFWNDLGDFFGERTVSLEVPYTAKYGTNLAKSDIKVTRKDKKNIDVKLEKPALQSIEMRLDRIEQFSKNGVFVFQKDDRLKMPLQKLYTETKKKLTGNTANIKLAQEKVEKSLNKFFEPLGYIPHYVWTN